MDYNRENHYNSLFSGYTFRSDWLVEEISIISNVRGNRLYDRQLDWVGSGQNCTDTPVPMCYLYPPLRHMLKR